MAVDTGTGYEREPSTYNANLTEVGHGTPMGELVRRYRDSVSPRKKTAATETIVLNAFLTRHICSKRLSELRTYT